MTGDDLDQPRAWRKLDEEQRELAAELVRRAEILREGSEEGLSIREALDIAARQIGHRRLALPGQPDPSVSQ